jgi:hypothetical protein
MTDIGPALHLGFSLLLLWGLIFFCWSPYRLDSLREKLFAIRNDLFQFAARGGISFSDPSYRTLRDLMNGMIRYAYKLNGTQLLLTAIAYSSRKDEQWRIPVRLWHETVEALPAIQKDKLMSSHDEMFRVVMKHIAGGNIILLMAFSLLKLLRLLVKVFTGGTTQNLSVLKAGRDLNLNLIEAQALKAHELENRYSECELALRS